MADKFAPPPRETVVKIQKMAALLVKILKAQKDRHGLTMDLSEVQTLAGMLRTMSNAKGLDWRPDWEPKYGQGDTPSE